MSLRVFHLIFVTITILLCVFLAVWSVNYAPAELEGLAHVLKYISFSGMVIMPIYGVIFYKKIKNFT